MDNWLMNKGSGAYIFKPVHLNYVPAKINKHINFLDFNTIGCSSLVARYWTGQLWNFKVLTLVVEHDDRLCGLDLWPEVGNCLTASVGADLRLNVWGPSLARIHGYLPVHQRLITGGLM